MKHLDPWAGGRKQHVSPILGLCGPLASVGTSGFLGVSVLQLRWPRQGSLGWGRKPGPCGWALSYLPVLHTPTSLQPQGCAICGSQS